ncbi:MAG: PAS domain-containing protein [Stenomitos frigidus ULC029]
MVSALWNLPGIQSHQALECLEQALAPLCIYDKHGQTIYASQSFVALLQAETECLSFLNYFSSTSTPPALLTNLWERALQGETVNFLAKTHDGQTSIECSLHFNQESHSMFLMAQKSECVELMRQAPERNEKAIALPLHPSLAVALVKQDGTIIKCNPKFHALLKTNERDVLSFDALTHPSDCLLDAVLRQELLDGAIHSYTVEKRLVTKNNDVVWVNVSVSLVEKCDDRHQCYFECLLDDITERRKVYSALVRTEAKWQALILNSPYLFIQTSNSGQIIYTSAAVEQLLGYREEELLGRHITELLHPNHFNEFELALQLWSSAVQPHQTEIECWWRTKTGRWVALYIQGQRFPSTSNSEGVMISGHNITDRKSLELELNASKERFRSLVLNLPGAAFRCNAVYTMTDISDGIEVITGYPAAALVNNQARSFLGIVHPDDISLLKDSLIQSVLDCHRSSIEYRLLHANGQIRWVSERKQGVFDQHGNLLWLDGVLIDISDRKQAEAELQQCEALNQTILQQCPDLARSGTLKSFPQLFSIKNAQ